VIAVEPDETLRTSAKRAAKLARVPIEVVDGFASALPLGDGSVDVAVSSLEDLLTPLWSGLAGGCHPNRDTVAAATAAGFEIQHPRRFGFLILAGIPAVSHVIVSARKLPIGE